MGPFNNLLWHRAGVLPEDYLQYRVLPDSQAEEVEQERQCLRGLRAVLDWRSFDSDPGEDAPTMSKVPEALKESIAEGVILSWVELRSMETIASEIAGGVRRHRPLQAAGAGGTPAGQAGPSVPSGAAAVLNIEVELREPFEEELEELRTFVRERT